MQFNTPYGTADDQSASYICGLEEGLAIGAITGGVNSSTVGGGTDVFGIDECILEIMAEKAHIYNIVEPIPYTIQRYTVPISRKPGSSTNYISMANARYLLEKFFNLAGYTVREEGIGLIPKEGGKTYQWLLSGCTGVTRVIRTSADYPSDGLLDETYDSMWQNNIEDSSENYTENGNSFWTLGIDAEKDEFYLELEVPTQQPQGFHYVRVVGAPYGGYYINMQTTSNNNQFIWHIPRNTGRFNASYCGASSLLVDVQTKQLEFPYFMELGHATTNHISLSGNAQVCYSLTKDLAPMTLYSLTALSKEEEAKYHYYFAMNLNGGVLFV